VLDNVNIDLIPKFVFVPSHGITGWGSKRDCMLLLVLARDCSLVQQRDVVVIFWALCCLSLRLEHKNLTQCTLPQLSQFFC
jgi:hypothetical protein